MRAALGVAASMALVANAVLIPSSMMADSLGDDLAMESLGINPFKRTVAIECPGCATAEEDNGVLAWSGNHNSFLLDFEIGPREDTLDIDGAQLYPPTFGHLSEPFYVTQVSSSGEPLRLKVTGYTFHFNSAKTVSEAGNELLPMTFQIKAIEGKFMEPPEITINLLKDTNGRLMIASFETRVKSAYEKEKECEQWPLLCKWKAMVADRIENIKEMSKDKIEQVKKLGKGCHDRPSHRLNGVQVPPPGSFGHPAGYIPEHDRPGHPHHPHHGHHHHHHGKPHGFLRRIAFTVLIPILIGIFAGALTYLVGMAIGCLIAVVVAKMRGQDGYEVISLDEEAPEEPIHNEKEVYVELPEYDAPPVYEEAAEKEVVEDSRKSDA